MPQQRWLDGSSCQSAVAASGNGVPRFDFTGRGSSDGDFTHTIFSGNIAAKCPVQTLQSEPRIVREPLEN